MKTELLELLRCPNSGQRLVLDATENTSQGIENGWMSSENGQHRYPIRDGIPRFVPQANYADNFGMQWNHFRQTQLDSFSGHSITAGIFPAPWGVPPQGERERAVWYAGPRILRPLGRGSSFSADRFWKATGWKPADINGQWILDAGCGAGRFAEVALNAGANLVALDYSSAVDACYANLKHHPNLHVVQGDIYALPFAQESFSYVYSLGVLQHTPDVARAFAALPPMVRTGGLLCTDYYWKRFRTVMHAKYAFRPLAKRVSQDKLFAFLERNVPAMLAASQALGSIPVLGKALKRLVPVADYTGIFPLTDQQLKEWALLDTFDMLAPTYDNPQSVQTVRNWLKKAGLQDIEVFHAAHLVGRGRKADCA